MKDIPLYVETGRFNNTPLERRLCTCCSLNEIEDEYHFLMIYPKYDNLRHSLLSKITDINLNICIWHSFECQMASSGISHQHLAARCWWRMPDEAIWYENECHMHFLTRHNHTMHYIAIFYNFQTWLSNFQNTASTKMAYYRSLVFMIISLKLARKCQIMTNISCVYT